jgi:hypothetical protein
MSVTVRSRSTLRVPLRIVAALAIALSLMASVSPARAAATKAHAKLTASLAIGTLLPHSSTTLSGTVTPRGNGVVVLQRYVNGAWVQIAHRGVSRSGHFSFPVRTSTKLGTTIYRIARGASGKTKALVSKSVHLHTVKTAFKVVAATRPAVASGAHVVVTGSVAHKATGFVSLQMLQHGAWKTMWTARLSKTSKFSFSHVLATGKYALRVRKAATATIAAGVSKTMTVTVAAPPAAPTAAVSLSGHLVTAGVYSGPVTATVTTTAPANVASLTYVLDGAAAKPYTAPVVVSTVGAHTFSVTVKDSLGRSATASSTWTISSLHGQPVPPTAVIDLAGTPSTGTTFIGAVTATITASDAGGPGIASVMYTFDSTSSIPYAGPITSPNLGPHTISVMVTDLDGNVGTATRTWSQVSKPDTTKPTGSITIAGSLSNNVYVGSVSVTLSGSDSGSGVGSITYTLDGGAAIAYTEPFSVAAPGSHTVVETVTDLAGNFATTSKTWNQKAVVGGSGDLVVSSADQATLGMPNARLVFSTNQANANPVPARQFTVTNATASKTITVTSLSIGGANPGSYHFATGQAQSFTLAPGGSALVSVVFQPSAPTNCPHGAAGSGTDTLIGDNVVQTATLTYTTNDGAQPSGTADLSGVNACFEGGNSEPVLDQVIGGLGYATDVDNNQTNRRFIGPLRYLPGSDEVQSPYFVKAGGGPVTLVPLAHYATGSTNPAGYHATGWYLQGSAMAQPESTCTAACNTLFNYPPDPSDTTYNQNQKLMPIPTGTTTFNPSGAFGIFSGDFSNVNFTDDALNVGHRNDNDQPLPVPHYLHDIRVYPAYSTGHVLIPNTFLITEDINRVPAFKNNDFQDGVYLLSNVQPAVGQGPVLSGTTSVDLTAGGTVNGCSVSGFDGILDDHCVPGNLHFTGAGLSITSTRGQLANNNQDNALYKSFDATRSPFTVTARVVGGIDQLSTDFQQIGAFFGTDENNFVKIEVEHNGSGTPHMTMFFRQNGAAGQSVTTIQPAGLTTASTVDLVIKGNGNLPDPLPFGDTFGVSGYPLDPIAVYYSIDGGPLTQLGTVTLYPANVPGFFSRSAKAGILDSNSGTTTSLTATFSRFTLASG